jgi:hypothetical protein
MVLLIRHGSFGAHANNARPPRGPSNSFKIFPPAPVTFSPTDRSPNSFSCNTYGIPRNCCKQKTYGKAKSFRCNTCKKHRGRGSHPSSQRLFSLRSASTCIRPIPCIFILFQTPLHSAEPQLLCFHANPNSFTKTPGGGGEVTSFNPKGFLSHRPSSTLRRSDLPTFRRA